MTPILDKQEAILDSRFPIHLFFTDDEAASAAVNMQRDCDLFEQVEKNPNKFFLRFYTWDKDYITYGRNQNLQDIKHLLEDNRSLEDLVRRPTGGGIVFHKKEAFTYSLVLPIKAIKKKSLLRTYYDISAIIRKILVDQGLDVNLAELPLDDYRRRRIEPLCQDFPAKYELLLGKKKVIGAAQKKGYKVLMQQTYFFINPPDLYRFKKRLIKDIIKLII